VRNRYRRVPDVVTPVPRPVELGLGDRVHVHGLDRGRRNDEADPDVGSTSTCTSSHERILRYVSPDDGRTERGSASDATETTE